MSQQPIDHAIIRTFPFGRPIRFGCPKIAQHLAKAFAINIDKDVVCRVLATHYRPERRDSGPSWLTFLGLAKDSLRSIDLFRTESILLKTHWILLIMDRLTRRTIGFGVQAVAVRKLVLFQRYYNGLRVPQGLDGDPPDEKAGSPGLEQARLERYAWRSHCHGLFDLPIAV